MRQHLKQNGSSQRSKSAPDEAAIENTAPTSLARRVQEFPVNYRKFKMPESPRILVLEKNESKLAPFVALLNALFQGCDVIEAESQEDAETALNEDSIDCFFLNPLASDCAQLFIEKLASDNETSTPVVILLDDEKKTDAQNWLNRGAWDWFTLDAANNNALLHRIVNHACEFKHMRDELNYVAQYDLLSGLPNRRMFLKRLHEAVNRSKRTGSPSALLLLGLDGFKSINESLNHGMGDKLLKEAAQRLKASVRTIDTAARLGGDEFAVILDGMTKARDGSIAVKRILDCFSKPFKLADREYTVTASIGAAVCPDDGDEAGELLKNAEFAMHGIKRTGRNNYRFFSRDMMAEIEERRIMMGNLTQALNKREFILHYQPQVSLSDGKIIGVEALMRWQSPNGMVSPAAYIPLLEESGLIVPVGEWVLREACAQARKWRRSNLGPIRMAVNFSPRQFEQNDLVEMVTQALDETGLEPELLDIELTESLVMKNPEQSCAMLTALKKTGIRTSLDDFGTGYSSLSCLKKFPLDVLKIDRSFVSNIIDDVEDAAIAEAIIQLGHTLNLEVIAEGVETEAQLQFLIDNKCDAYQGYLFSRPLSSKECSEFIASKMSEYQSSSRG